MKYTSKKQEPNPEGATYVQNRTASDLTRDNLQERMFFLMLNEAVRCLEEKIVATPEDVDFVMIMGTGFALFRGGHCAGADSLGLEKIVGAMQILTASGEVHTCALCFIAAHGCGQNEILFPIAMTAMNNIAY